MVEIGMGMEYPKGVLLCGNIIPQHQVKLKALSPLTGNRRNGIVGFPFCLCKNKCILIRISSPMAQNQIRQGDYPLPVLCP